MLNLRCSCGAVHATARHITPRNSAHLVCYCVDCQAYARFLDRQGLLDAHGGTAVFLAAPADLTFSQGTEQLACVRLSAKGLFRWYTKCCRTPVGNTSGTPLMAMVTVPDVFVDRSSAEATPEALLGKPVGIKGSSALGGMPEGVHPGLPVGPIAGIVWRVLRAKFAGKVLASAERAALSDAV